VSWTVRYRSWEAGQSRLVDAVLDPAWAVAAGFSPQVLGSAQSAAFALGLVLGSNGNEECELVSVTGTPPLPPRVSRRGLG
jgi:hypothetical protein